MDALVFNNNSSLNRQDLKLWLASIISTLFLDTPLPENQFALEVITDITD